MGTTLDEPLYYMNSTSILARTGLHFHLTFTHSLLAHHNPSPYTLLVIPCLLPTEVVEGEHYVIADLLSLVLISSSPSQASETEVVGRELEINLLPEQPYSSREDPDISPRASKEVDRGSCPKRLPFTKKGSRPPPQVSKKERWVPKRRRAPGTGVEDIVPWVAPILSLLPASEEEDEMANRIHNFGVQKRKLGASFKRGN